MTVNEIKQSITIFEVIERYSTVQVKRNRCACPLHSGKDFNMAIYPDTNSFYCFKCGVGGDVIRFVQELLGVDHQRAIELLGGDIRLSVSEKRLMNKKMYKKSAEKEKINAIEKNYNDVLDECIRLDQNFHRYKPKKQDEYLHPLFIEALKKREYYGYRLDLASNEVANCR